MQSEAAGATPSLHRARRRIRRTGSALGLAASREDAWALLVGAAIVVL